MKKNHFTLLIFLGLTLLLLSGCYTKLRPSADEEPSARGENYNQQYGYSHYYYPGYWSYSPRWGRYYATPWWWDYYGFDNSYYYDDDDRDYNSPQSTGGRRTPRTRFREPRPPASSGSGGVYTGGSSTKQVEQKQPADNSNTAVKQKQSDTEQKNTKPTRTGGGRKKR